MEILTGTVRQILEKVDLGTLPSTHSQRVVVEQRVFNVEQVRPTTEVDVSVANVPPQLANE